ncbi:Acetylcholine receptor subunit alpha-type acr-16 [Eumeta japonica]|uniref:Acetylcholine receptor subunit alpha-type acr-16 n=1 Tax=Eumeta variegata TaxID=151549 RepID=A0A4C1X6H9_EUMVA|nr:Acetylcholine receptor subunit alpha-type acr-16 [Eumeta japonica]
MRLCAAGARGGYHEKRLLHHLLDHYNVLERPVVNESDPLQLSFGLTLMQIIDVEWNDMNLRWNTSDFGGVKDLRVPPNRIWKPDVLMYNSKPTQLRQAKSVGKENNCGFFFPKTGPVCTISLEGQMIVNAERYTTICLPSVLEKVRKKRQRGRILLHNDNASPHTANKTMSFLTSEKVMLVTHPALSPDLAPCDFIFPKIKNLMKGLTFTRQEEVVMAFNEHMQNMPSD